MKTVTESNGIVCIDGHSIYNVTVCSKCGACITITIKQRLNGTPWLLYMDDNIPCCDEPEYFWGDFENYYKLETRS